MWKFVVLLLAIGATWVLAERGGRVKRYYYNEDRYQDRTAMSSQQNTNNNPIQGNAPIPQYPPGAPQNTHLPNYQGNSFDQGRDLYKQAMNPPNQPINPNQQNMGQHQGGYQQHGY